MPSFKHPERDKIATSEGNSHYFHAMTEREQAGSEQDQSKGDISYVEERFSFTQKKWSVQKAGISLLAIMDDLVEFARRTQGLENLHQVKYAVLVKDGSISIIPQ